MSTKQKPEGILDEAIRITSGDRQRDYDHPLPNHERIAELWNAYLNIRKNPDGFIEAEDVAAMMILLKLCLLYTSPSPRDGLLSRMPSSA